jgi:hypothetical protein
MTTHYHLHNKRTQSFGTSKIFKPAKWQKNFGYFFCSWLLLSCGGNKYGKLAKSNYYQFSQTTAVPNYANMDYWAAHPWKKDPSDSIPQPLLGEARDSLVDVFFVHPTTYIGDTKDAKRNANINDAELNAKTDYSSLLYQASVFNHQCRVFAPRYRQAHYDNYFVDSSIALPIFDTAYHDVLKAFQFYLQHYNNGRPFIIASHSQGTNHSMRLLKEQIEGKPLMQKMVYAFIIGMPVPKGFFQQLPACDSKAATGCFVAYRTYKTNHVEPYVAKETFKSIVVNPVTWQLDSSIVDKQQHRGAMLWDFNKFYPANLRTQVHGNVLWCSKPKFFGNIFLTNPNYHIADYNLFYLDIRQNITDRINAYWKR